MQNPGKAFAAGVVILGAGRSRRMGRSKLLLPWGNTSVLGHLLQQWKLLRVRQIAVVCAADAPEIQRELDKVGFSKTDRIENAAPERGMFSSIQCAAAWHGWNPELTHWTVSLGDQPHLREATLQRLLLYAAANPDRICQPLQDGWRGHPVVFPAAVFLELLKTSGAKELKHFLAEHEGELAGFESDDAGLGLDMDTPTDYERARRLYFGRE